MVDTAEFAYVARGIQQRFRQRGFADVNMRQNAGDDSFHGLLPLPSYRRSSSLSIYESPYVY